MASRQERNQVSQHVLLFNRNVQLLLNEIQKNCSDAPAIDRLRKRINLALAANPVVLITRLGSGMFAHHEQIFAGRWEHFLELDYTTELQKVTDPAAAEILATLVGEMRQVTDKLSPADREDWGSLVAEALEHYMHYVDLTAPQ